MRTILAAIVAAVLFTPTSSAAAPLSFIVTDNAELSVSFGLASFSTSGELQGASLFDAGSASLVSGPLLNIQVDDVNGLTTYNYGAGTLALILTVEDKHFNPITGNFLAETLPFSFVVCEGCDVLFGGGNAQDFEIKLGAGLFDAPVAHALGVRPQTAGNFINFSLEAIDGDAAANARSGFDSRGFAELEIGTQDVPEPGLLLLLTAGAAAIYGRRGSSRARTSGRR